MNQFFDSSPTLPGLSAMLHPSNYQLSPRDAVGYTPLAASKLYNAEYMHPNRSRPAAVSAEASESLTRPTKVASISKNPKNSRYLREMDRREILTRIAKGEKQSALAKEFNVSRAAICNLNKHRDEVLRRKDGNPMAKHPKKPRSKSNLMKSKTEEVPARNGVYEVKSRAVALLLTTLKKKHATVSEFRRSSDRLMRLILEEALAHVPIKTVDLFLSNRVQTSGVALEHPPCAISMEPAGCPMLDLFHQMEPHQPTAYVSFGDIAVSPGDSPSDVQVKLYDARLPSTLNFHNVFVVDHVVTSAELVVTVVRRLQERGAVEAMISLVALVATADAVEKLRAALPELKIVVAQIDHGDDMLTTTASASTTDMILDRMDQVYHVHMPASAY